MKNKDILLKDNKNNNLYPLAHKDSEQNVINDFYSGARVWLASNTNLNDIIKPGSYWLASGRNFTNAPWSSGSGKYGLLEVSKAEGDAGSGGGAKRIIQKITRTVVSNSNITEITFWYRYYGTNGWSNWLEYSGTDSTNSFGLIEIPGATISASIPGDSFGISGGAGVLLSTSNNILTIGVDTGTLGGGTVTNVAIANSGGLSVTGSPITTTGTINIGHINNITSQQTVGLYPLAFDSYGHITSYSTAVTIPTVYNSSLSFYRDNTLIRTFTANASANKSVTFTTSSINITNLLSKSFVDSITWTDGTKPTRASKTVVIGGSTTSIPTITAKSVVNSVTFNNVITGGSTTAFKPVTKKTVVTGGSTTSIYTPAAKSVVTSATATSASYSSGILYITNGSFTTGNSIDFSSEAVNVYTSLTTGDSVTEGNELSVYTSLTTSTAGSATLADSINIDTSNTTTVYTSLNTSSIYEITGVGTMPTLSYTTSNINSYVTTTSVTVLNNVS